MVFTSWLSPCSRRGTLSPTVATSGGYTIVSPFSSINRVATIDYIKG